MSTRKQPTPWKTHAACAFIAIALTAGAVAGILAPRMLSSADSPAAQRERLQALTRTLYETEATLKKSRSLLAQLQEQEKSVVSLVPPSQLNTRLAEIAAIAESAGLTLSVIAPQPETAEAAKKNRDARATRITIRLGGTATYAAITRFLDQLHAKFRDTAVVQMSISGQPSEKPSPAPCAFELTWYAAPEAFAGADGK